jgi:hypothetical protein
VWSLRFDIEAQQVTLSDYASEVDHARDRVARLDRAIDVAIDAAPATMRVVLCATPTFASTFGSL